jgi:AraC-like DNA-binding protein
MTGADGGAVVVDEFSTEGLPPGERFGYWAQLTARTQARAEMSSDHATGFRGELRLLHLGAVQVSVLTHQPLRCHRTPAMIRQCDPGRYHLSLGVQGTQGFEQLGRRAARGPGELTLHDTSRPFRGWTADGTVRAVVVQLPKSLVPFPERKTDQLLAVTASGREGVGGLLAQFLTTVAAEAGHYGAADAARIGGVLFDLSTSFLAHLLEREARPAPPNCPNALTHRIQTYIQRHLDDPELTPGAIASVHHISTRYLHRLFEDEGLTVAAWIRRQRLERCRRDLTNAASGNPPIHAIAARWGFVHPSDFSRAFRTAYGTSPREYREAALRGAVVQRGSRGVRSLPTTRREHRDTLA